MRQGSLGFTLVELAITLLLTAILVTLGVPAMRDLIQNNRQATRINEVLVSLNLARAEAVKRGANTVVCISDGAAAPDCNTNTSTARWEDGWIVFVDGNGTGALDNPDTDGRWDAGEDWLVRTHAALDDGTTLSGNANVALAVNYNARGFSGTAGTLRLCDSRGPQEARGIVISNTGRPRLAIDSDADGIVEDGGENNLICP